MRFEDLQVFISVVEYGSMIKAAEELHLSQQTISLTIKSLESELQKKLLIRSKKGSTVTEDGKEVYLVAKDVLKKISTLYPSDSPNEKKMSCAKFSILYAPAFFPIVNNLINEIMIASSTTNIFTNECDAFQLDEMILNNKTADNIIMTTIDAADFEKYCSHLNDQNGYVLAKSRLKLAVGVNSKLSSKKTISLYSLEKIPHIVYKCREGVGGDFFSSVVNAYGVQMKNIISLNDTNMINKYIINGWGYSLVADYGKTNFGENTTTRSIPITPRIDILFVVIFPQKINDSISACEEIFKTLYYDKWEGTF